MTRRIVVAVLGLFLLSATLINGVSAAGWKSERFPLRPASQTLPSWPSRNERGGPSWCGSKRRIMDLANLSKDRFNQGIEP